MEEERRKARRLVIAMLAACLCVALACFGVFLYLLLTSRRAQTVNPRIVEVSKIIVLVGIFFLVLAFGYLLPVLLSSKTKGGDPVSEIFDEATMRKTLERYIPDGEPLLAGIHAVSRETSIRSAFSNCILTESALLPAEDGETIALYKKKYSTYDVYIGVTRSFLIITECERNSYYYKRDEEAERDGTRGQPLTSQLFLSDIGTCYPLAEIQSCGIKKGWMGSVNCTLTMKNGSYFKLMFPKLGGLGGKMPHHAEYREAIIARLGGENA